jgi:hypothetical protein
VALPMNALGGLVTQAEQQDHLAAGEPAVPRTLLGASTQPHAAQPSGASLTSQMGAESGLAAGGAAAATSAAAGVTAAAMAPAAHAASGPGAATAAAAPDCSAAASAATSQHMSSPQTTAFTATTPRKQRRAGRNGPDACATRNSGWESDPNVGLCGQRSAGGVPPSMVPCTALAPAEEAERRAGCSSAAVPADNEGTTAQADPAQAASRTPAVAACLTTRTSASTAGEAVPMPQTPPLVPEVAASKRDDHTTSNAAGEASSTHAGSADMADAVTDSQDTIATAAAQEQAHKVTKALHIHHLYARPRQILVTSSASLMTPQACAGARNDSRADGCSIPGRPQLQAPSVAGAKC